jgi:hypothetical protein
MWTPVRSNRCGSSRRTAAAGAFFLAVAGCAAAGCDPPSPLELQSADPAAARTPPSGIAPPLPTAAPGVVSATRPAAVTIRTGAACAPSLAFDKPIDARSERALARCERLRTGQERFSTRCGQEGRSRSDLAQLLAAVPELDAATVERVRAVAAKGKARGKNPRAFGLVGDSVSVAYEFMTPLSSSRERPVEIDPWAAGELAIASGGTVVDWYRGAPADAAQTPPRDAFSSFRAAQVGARASWPASEAWRPIDELEQRVNPAVAVVTFGANDAAYKPSKPEDLADEFERATLELVDNLEARGIVVILSNEMRHGDQPGRDACPGDDPGSSDWQVAVAQNATSARAAEIACRDHHPFIDLRFALEAATNFGLGPDGVHLSSHKHGAALFDRAGLDCGYNTRNFVTLLALARVLPHVQSVYDSSSQ